MGTYIIGEIGQNHNGDMAIAKRLIDMAANPIMDYWSGKELKKLDAVKFTKRCLDEELTPEEAARPYTSPNSFGKTYGEHRAALEFTYEQHAELEQYARSKGLGFVETICSPGCVSMLDVVKVDAIKIASRDVTNFPLLERLGDLEDVHIIMSSGMSNLDDIDAALEVLLKKPKKLSILHCLSQYPAQYENINLRAMEVLRERYPEHDIGYSDHSIGIVVPSAAVAMGAKIIEKHITLDRSMKGSDQAGSIEPEGLWRMIRDIRNIEEAVGEPIKETHPSVAATAKKLQRSLAIRHDMKKGQTIKEEDLFMVSPGDGMSWQERSKIVGKTLVRDLAGQGHIHLEDVE